MQIADSVVLVTGASLQADPTAPEEVARQVFTALRAGAHEVLADALSRQVRASFAQAEPVYLLPAAP